MTATIGPETKSASRRALLAGALGGLGAWAASAIGRASPVRGADGQTVLVGGEYTASTVTGFSTTTNDALYGTSTSGIGVFGHSSTDVGVYGRGTSNTQPATVGQSNGNGTGVLGASGGDVALPAAKPKTGVYGYANQDSASHGVWGESPTGIGVVGSTSNGYAGYFIGKVFSSRFYELSENVTPLAPVANRARLFIRDSAGKTQLCVRFHTGAVKVLATEP